MKIFKYNQFQNQQLNESWKDIILGSIFSIQSLCSIGSPVIRTGLGGVHDGSKRHRDIDYEREWNTDQYANQNGRTPVPHWDYTTHSSSDEYADLFNQLLNDLDSIKVDNPDLNIIKNRLQWGNQSDNLNIPEIIEGLKKFSKNQKFSHIDPILNGLSKYESKDLESMSISDANRERGRLLKVLEDVKNLMDDEKPFTSTILFKAIVIAILIFILIQLINLGVYISDNIRQRRNNRREDDTLGNVNPQ